MHPSKDLVLACCADSCVRLFSLNDTQPLARFASHSSPPAAAFDKEGIVFACASGRQVHLFDTNSYKESAFAGFDLSDRLPRHAHITSLLFSPAADHLLVGASTSDLLLLDAIYGRTLNALRGSSYDIENGSASRTTPPPPPAAFSPDGQFVFCGSDESPSLDVWEALGGRVGRLDGHTQQPRFLAFHPTRAVLASASCDVALWLPKTPP